MLLMSSATWMLEASTLAPVNSAQNLGISFDPELRAYFGEIL